MSDREIPLEYAVKVEGFDATMQVAMTPSRARARTWESYRCAYDGTTFKDFMKICKSIRQTGREFTPALVSGELAYLVPGESIEAMKSKRFVRPFSDTVMTTHYLDVEPLKDET